jgi:hypothetical protein
LRDDASRYARVSPVFKRLGYRQLRRADHGPVLA